MRKANREMDAFNDAISRSLLIPALFLSDTRQGDVCTPTIRVFQHPFLQILLCLLHVPCRLQIPSLCYAPEAEHQASCMVCMVKDVRSGQMIPSCSTFPQEGMEKDTESEEVMELRKMGIELLLSDHGACCGVCEGKEKCKLRELSVQMKAKWTRFGPIAPVGEKEQIHVCGHLYFEPAKCIRCGLCVYNSDNGFTFQHRGFNMQVIIPDENKSNVDERLADLCPTGALILK